MRVLTTVSENIWSCTAPASLQLFLYKHWHKLPRGRTNPDLFYRNKGIKLKCSHWVSRVHKYAPMGQQHLLRFAPSNPPISLFRSTVASLSLLTTPDQRETNVLIQMSMASRFQNIAFICSNLRRNREHVRLTSLLSTLVTSATS